MVLLICTTAGILLGGYIGYRIGGHFSRLESQTVKAQNELLRQYSIEWANAARNSSQLSGEISDRHVNQVATTMGTVIQLLQNLEQRQYNSMESEQAEAIQKLLNDARAISPTSEFE